MSSCGRHAGKSECLIKLPIDGFFASDMVVNICLHCLKVCVEFVTGLGLGKAGCCVI